MSNLRNRIERQRAEALEAQQTGRPALPPIKPEQPATRRSFTHQDAEDAAALRPAGGANSPRARMEPRLAPVATPVPLTHDQLLWQRGVEEQRRKNEIAARAREVQRVEAARQADIARVNREAQAAAARQAGEAFEEQTNEIRNNELLGRFTLAEAEAIELQVRQQFGNTTDPAAYELVIRERQREADARKVLATAPVDVLDEMTDKDLGDFLGVSTATAAKLRGEI